MPQINFERLRSDLEELSSIGQNPDRSVSRPAFSDADLEARNWLEKKIRDAGLLFRRDGAGNLFGKLSGKTDSPVILTGSHLDTVPGGGHLDGALGVLTSLEAIRTIHEKGIRPERSIELVAFSDEEGRFGGMFGSSALAGELTPEQIHSAVDLNGISLIDEMARHGLNAMDALHARRKSDEIFAYLELHIEQGPVLYERGKHTALVEAITGLFKWSVRFIGEADHAGTTPMAMRKDAFMGLAEFANEIPRIVEENGSDQSTITIGRVSITPGSANTVPGMAEFSIDCRDTDPEILATLEGGVRTTLSAIARRRGLMFEFDILSNIAPVRCSPDVTDAIGRAATRLGIELYAMNSGAAHDAQILSQITRAGMIFTPSVRGRSHSAAEWTHPDDIELGARLVCETLLDLSGNK